MPRRTARWCALSATVPPARLNPSARPCAQAAAAATPASTLPAKNEDTTVLVLGPTGYIGRYVTKELISRGYKVVAFSRERSGVGGKKSKEEVAADFAGAHKVVFGDVKARFCPPCACLALSLQCAEHGVPASERLRGEGGRGRLLPGQPHGRHPGAPRLRLRSHVASRSPGEQDSWDVDYQATLNCLEAGRAQARIDTGTLCRALSPRRTGRQALRPPLRDLRAEAAAHFPAGEAQV